MKHWAISINQEVRECLGPHARTVAHLMPLKNYYPGPVQAIDEADLMEKLYGELDSDRTKKTSKALLQ